MQGYAVATLGGPRWQALSTTIRFEGVDLTGSTFQLQVRLLPNTPGAPLIGLATVGTAAAEGVRLVSVDTAGEKPVSTIGIRINETTMEALPFTGETGDSSVFAWDMQVTRPAGLKAKWIGGDFIVEAGVTGADGAMATIGGYPVRNFPQRVSSGSASFQVGDSVIQVTMAGGEGPPGRIGDASGPLGFESVTAETIDGSEANAIADKIGALRPGATFASSFTPSETPEPGASGLVYMNAALNSGFDIIRLETSHLIGSACYSLHITDNAETGAVGGGGIGVAMSGPGTAPAGVYNRYGSGSGDGILAQRVGSGNGFGLQASFAGLGTGAAVRALKQNANGQAGGPSGLGPALDATNSSEQGEAIASLTEANNQSLVSNTFTRRNIGSGIIARYQYLLGGARTAGLTGVDVLIQPATALTGNAPVAAYAATVTANVTGANTATGYDANIAASGCVKAYGFAAVVTGANATNYGGYFAASGGTNNFAIYCANGDAYFAERVVAPNLPVFADNAAASASLQIGVFYRKPTGELMVRY